MHRLALILLICSSAHAEHFAPPPDSPSARARSNQQIRDARVGYCSAYHILLGDHEAGLQVQRLATDRLLMAQSGYALTRYFPGHELRAMEIGYQACKALNFRTQ